MDLGFIADIVHRPKGSGYGFAGSWFGFEIYLCNAQAL